MFHQLLQVFNSTTHMLLRPWKRGYMSRRVLFILIATLLTSFVQISFYQHEAYAAELNMKLPTVRTTPSVPVIHSVPLQQEDILTC